MSCCCRRGCSVVVVAAVAVAVAVAVTVAAAVAVAVDNTTHVVSTEQ